MKTRYNQSYVLCLSDGSVFSIRLLFLRSVNIHCIGIWCRVWTKTESNPNRFEHEDCIVETPRISSLIVEIDNAACLFQSILDFRIPPLRLGSSFLSDILVARRRRPCEIAGLDSLFLSRNKFWHLYSKRAKIINIRELVMIHDSNEYGASSGQSSLLRLFYISFYIPRNHRTLLSVSTARDALSASVTRFTGIGKS